MVLHGIVAVGGNVALADTAANARFLGERFGLDVPVVAGAAAPLDGQVRGDAAAVHGSDGLGGLRPDHLGFDVLRDATSPDPEATAALYAELTGAEGERVLLATGPLTNVAHLLRQQPALAAGLDRVVAMGGGFGAPRGNVTVHAEFNAWADPAAFAEVLLGGVPIELVPLDVTTRVVVDRDDIAAIDAAVGRSSLVTRILAAGIDLYERLGRPAVFEMHDPLAALAVWDPSVIGWHAGTVEVSAHGVTSGRTDLIQNGRAEGPHRVALDVDAGVAHGRLLELLSDTARAEAALDGVDS